jgi:hypothetical protein
MNNEVKEPVVAPDAATDSTPKKEGDVAKAPKTYDNSHLIQYCGKCNSKSILIENIPSTQGITINLPPTNESEFILACKDCGNKMGIFYVEAIKKATEAEAIKEGDSDDKPVSKTNKKK